MKNVLLTCLSAFILFVTGCSSDDSVLDERFILKKYTEEDKEKLQKVLSEEEFAALDKGISIITFSGEDGSKEETTYRKILEEVKKTSKDTTEENVTDEDTTDTTDTTGENVTDKDTINKE